MTLSAGSRLGPHEILGQIGLTPDGKAWAYSYNRVTASDLYLVSGWK